MWIDENYTHTQKQTNKQNKQEKNYQLFVHYVVAADFSIFCSRMGASTQSSSVSIIESNKS